MPYRPTERTEARKAATRERIVAAALDQVAEGGYASASVQAVAGRAGLAVGTLYRHFPSKAELFAEVFRRASQRELDVLIEVSSGDAPGARRPARPQRGPRGEPRPVLPECLANRPGPGGHRMTTTTSQRDTHAVENQAPPLVPYNVFEADAVLCEAVEREGGGWGV